MPRDLFAELGLDSPESAQQPRQPRDLFAELGLTDTPESKPVDDDTEAETEGQSFITNIAKTAGRTLAEIPSDLSRAVGRAIRSAPLDIRVAERRAEELYRKADDRAARGNKELADALRFNAKQEKDTVERWKKSLGKEDDTAFFKAASAIEKYANENFRTDTEFQKTLSSGIAQGLTSVLGYTVAGLLTGGAGVTGIGMAQGSESARTRVKEAGGGEPEQEQAASGGAFLGTLEAIPVTRILGKLNKMVKGRLREKLLSAGVTGLEEATTEAVQSVGEDVIVKSLTDEEISTIDMAKNAWQNFKVGGITGTMADMLMMALGAKLRGKTANPTQDDIQDVAGLKEEPTAEPTVEPVKQAVAEQKTNVEIAADELMAKLEAEKPPVQEPQPLTTAETQPVKEADVVAQEPVVEPAPKEITPG